MVMTRASDTHLRTTAFQHRRVVDLFFISHEVEGESRLERRAACIAVVAKKC